MKSPPIRFDAMTRFRKDPMGFVKRVAFKGLLGPILYRKGKGYDAPRYWDERFSKYGMDLRGPGDERLSEEENREMYREAGETFLGVCKREGLDLAKSKVLEIGCGTGFYTGLLKGAGVRSYQAADITDALFKGHRSRFPEFTFAKKDVTVEKLEGEFDLVVIIDVIQHIVERSRFEFAMRNIRDVLRPGGTLIISPVSPTSKKHLFYVHSWSLADLRSQFPGFVYAEPVEFRQSRLLALRKPAG